MSGEQHINDLMESLKPHLQTMQRQMDKDAAMFRRGRITQQEYERRCQWRGFAPVDIVGFYKWDGSHTSGEPDWRKP